jgi:hypothetical protein
MYRGMKNKVEKDRRSYYTGSVPEKGNFQEDNQNEKNFCFDACASDAGGLLCRLHEEG